MKLKSLYSPAKPWLRAVGASTIAGALPILGVFALGIWGKEISAWLAGQPTLFLAPLLVVLGSTLCGLALLPSHAVSLAVGWCLGSIAGPPIALIAISCGALISFTIGSRITGPGIRLMLEESPRWSAIYQELVGSKRARGAIIVALLRLSPATPFAATNIFLAAVGLPLSVFLAGTMLGLAPRVIVICILGSQMAELDWSSPDTPLFAVFGVIAALLALLFIGWAAKAPFEKVLSSKQSVSRQASGDFQPKETVES